MQLLFPSHCLHIFARLKVQPLPFFPLIHSASGPFYVLTPPHLSFAQPRVLFVSANEGKQLTLKQPREATWGPGAVRRSAGRPVIHSEEGPPRRPAGRATPGPRSRIHPCVHLSGHCQCETYFYKLLKGETLQRDGRKGSHDLQKTMRIVKTLRVI